MLENQKIGLMVGGLAVFAMVVVMGVQAPSGSFSATALKSPTANTAQKTIPVTPACTFATAPWIKVTNPNGGQQFWAGKPVNITWTSCNIPANHNIGIILNQTAGGNSANLPMGQTMNTGSFSTLWPTKGSWNQIIFGNNFKISVADISVGSPADQSDTNFMISDNSGQCVDSKDNDNDGQIDFPYDAGCTSPIDPTE